MKPPSPPIPPSGPKAPELTVSIYLRGDRLQPDHITEVLGIQPSGFQKKGELRPGSKVIAKIGVWSFIARTDSRVATDHIEDLLSQMKMRQGPLDRILGVDEAFLDIFIALDYENGTRERVEFMLSKKHVEELNQLGLRVQITVM